jgi:hypothetical protein
MLPSMIFPMEQDQDPDLTTQHGIHFKGSDPTQYMNQPVVVAKVDTERHPLLVRGGRLILAIGISAAALSAGDAWYLHLREAELTKQGMTKTDAEVAKAYIKQAKYLVAQGEISLIMGSLGGAVAFASSRKRR